MLQVASIIIFYVMMGLLLLLLWQVVQNGKIYAQAWLTLVDVNKQNADSMQKIADANQTLARVLEKAHT